MDWQQVRALPKMYRSFMLLVVGLWLVTGCNSTRVPRSGGVSATPASAPPPVPTSTPDFIAQGREVFLRVCAQCHGQNGEGHIVEPAPALDHSEHAWHHPDQQIRDWINNGKLGFGEMPALGDQLSDQEIEAVIAYLHTLWTPEQLATQQDITGRYRER